MRMQSKWLLVGAACVILLIIVYSVPHGLGHAGRPEGARQQERLVHQDAERARFLQAEAEKFAAGNPAGAHAALTRAALSIYHNGKISFDSEPTVDDRSARHLLDAVIQDKPSVQCASDPSLPMLTSSSGHIMLAADLHNNAHVLPHFIYQLLQVIAIIPERQAFVSIYESGSDDNTLLWLALLKTLLNKTGTRYRIVTSGREVRRKKQDRIDFLARVRNAALQPLWEENAAHRFDADRIVFLNDVFYCAKDVVRLLLHNAHIACGLDFDVPDLLALSDADLTTTLVEHLHKRYWMPEWAARMAATVPRVRRSFKEHQPNSRAYQRRAPLGFYDIWVAHDADGHAFSKSAPYVSHLYSQERLRQGLPIPVHCCWNGLVVLDAAPFRRGLRFRMHEPGECAASECSLMCDDFKRMGYSNAVLDPGVRHAYVMEFAEQVYNPERVLELTVTQWLDVVDNPPIDLATVSPAPNTWCCFLQDGKDMVDFATDCKVYSPFAINFTQSFLHSTRHERYVSGSGS